ncbi:mannonate dehydratase [Neptunitalea chrysea]|nr:mannonate dehydratase [Neptunitalea chrysea]
MRWYGAGDILSLSDLKQAGITGIVTSLHHIPVGEIWSKEEIANTKQIIESDGLTWEVVESLPVHEHIKQRTGNFEKLIENYITSLKHLAEQGIKVVTYNFMPVLDWVRTDHFFKNHLGAEVLLFNPVKFSVFDLFILQRPLASQDYTQPEIQEAKAYYISMSEADKSALSKSILLGLPGSNDNFTLQQLLEQIKEYQKISTKDLQNNLIAFLKAICPTAEALGIKLAIHPDDPPFSILGLPRIVSTAQQLNFIFSQVPSPSNGLCYCTGSLGAGNATSLVSIFETHKERIHFLHLRNVTKSSNGVFYESNHLEGDVPMKTIMKLILQYTRHTGKQIPMRPDHGYLHSLEKEKPYYAGYSFIGRLKGLAELTGLEVGLIDNVENSI